MKKVLIACMAVSLFIACSKKDFPKWLHKYEKPKLVVPCKIDSIAPVDEGDPMVHGWDAVGIHYNDKGNPFVVNYTSQHLGVSQFAVHYKYDNKNRLIEVDPPNVDPVHIDNSFLTPVTPHKFVYEGNSSLPIRDSILSDTFFGIQDGTAYKAYTVKIEDLYYDKQGRIIRVITRSWYNNTLYPIVYHPDRETIYSYDVQDNRQVLNDGYGNTPTTITYTNNPSLYSLHPVWQLIHKNWSKNAAQMDVQSANSYGLPTRADISREGFLQMQYSESSNPFVNITYTCFQLRK